jgi:DNA-binding helix-hairpin-helix protein with protein kinase domain
MARKHADDDQDVFAADDEIAAAAATDTPDAPEPPPPEPEPEVPPLERLRNLLIALHHQAFHNAPVSTGIINELREIADKLDPEHAERTKESGHDE